MTTPADAKFDGEIISEGRAKILFPKGNQVFYNKVQVLNRDLSIAVINQFAHERAKEAILKQRKREKNEDVPTEDEVQAYVRENADTKGLKIFEALAASGLRSIRYLQEIEGVKSILVNDLEPAAVISIKRNIEYNHLSTDKLIPNEDDATAVMYSHRKEADNFDVIDLDPYGSASIFLDGAVQAIANGGLLCVTCTDMPVLCGKDPDVRRPLLFLRLCRAVCRNPDVGVLLSLRRLLHAIESAAVKYQKHIVPIISCSIDFYVRVFVRVYKSPVNVKASMTKQSNGIGPIWSAPLHNKDLVLKIREHVLKNAAKYPTKDRLHGLLTSVSEEVVDAPLYYTLPGLSKTLHCQQPRMDNKVWNDKKGEKNAWDYIHMDERRQSRDRLSRNFWTSGTFWRFIYPIRFLKVYVEGRRVINRFHNDMTPLTLFAVNAYLQIFCLLFCSGGVIQIAETTYGDMDTYNGEWTFFNSCFNSLLLFVAMNYPTADNTLTKCFVMFLIVLLIIVVPYQLSIFFEIYGSYSAYEYAVLTPSKRMKHIVLCGDLTPNRIEQFFNEIFHEDHDLVDTRVAVLSDEDPSSDLVAMLLDPFVAKRTTFLKGSILHDYDAARASCASASAIFVLTRKVGQEDVNVSDHRTFMRAMAAHRVAKHVPIYAQLHLSSNKHLFHDVDQSNVLCFSEVIHSILAQNCLLSAWIYSRCNGVILFAIHVQSVDGHGTIVLNPGSTYHCRGGEIGFVIAKDRKTADHVTSLAKETLQPAVSSHSMLKADSFHDMAIVASEQPKKKGNNGGSLQALKKKRNSRTLIWAAKEPKPAGQGKRSLKDCVVFDATKVKFASAPIVVCLLAPTFPDHMEYFVVPLRSPVVKEHHPIVFLTHKLPTRESFEPLSCYADLYFVETTKICLESLKRGGIEIARRIVLMCGGGEFAETSTRAPSVITELVNRANVHFISHNIGSTPWFTADDDPNSELSLVDAGSFSRSRAFASGLTYSTSLCDSLMINQFFNPMIKNIVREFVFSALRAVREVPPSASLPPMSPTGSPERIPPAPVEGALTPLVNPTSRIEIPEPLRPVPYGFAYVNPKPLDIMTGNDLIYVLAHKQPFWIA
ncbi:hypothetical protein DYB32_001366 [Aphanomyces invadans]|uniref:tRNA (guanine(26)-N(2))-dimethyltransferase n=1 Tax=Aphanomyces invadans TaxID=157072 RepID=A0A3R7D5V2_9STRA|nr:hypothetical protein DYB32_001366 [Aphanomyces invadans]